MSRYPRVPKTIHGVEVTQDIWKNTILDTIRAMPDGGRAGDLVLVMGPEWSEGAPRQLLQQTLITMWKQGLLDRAEDDRGRYVAKPKRNYRGVSKMDVVERQIVGIMREHGGMCRWRDIFEGMGMRPHGKELKAAIRYSRRSQVGNFTDDDLRFGNLALDDRGTYGYRFVVSVMERSPILRQDLLEPGLWNLPMKEINQMPLRGRWAAKMIKFTRAERFPEERRSMANPHYMAWMDDRDDFFSRIGSTFAQVRMSAKVSRDELIDDPEIANALFDMAHTPYVARQLTDFWAGETEAHVEQMIAGGAPAEEIAAYRETRRAANRHVLREVLTMFEMGGEEHYGVNAHLAAPLRWYTTFADAFGLNPVYLSRGMVIYQVEEDMKLRPSRNVADLGRKLDVAEARREAAERARSGVSRLNEPSEAEKEIMAERAARKAAAASGG